MFRRCVIAAAVLAAGGLIFAQGGGPATDGQTEKKLIDLRADLTGPIAPGDSVIFLVGNFAAQHNGAVITCDSAVRYSDRRIEFFGNVLINKNTTYIYGDRADYNGDLNEARVYSDLIKVVDGDATLYTYEFAFNTLDNVGRFGGGGILVNRENLLESERGYYYADTKELVCVERVEMRNDEYELRGDSVVYDMATDHAYYFEHTNIWNRDGDYLYADRGAYDKADTLYSVTRNGYLLTERQEVWSDSIDYYRAAEHAVLRRDIQIDDTEHKVLAFGDYGAYWKEPGNAFLTRRPSVVSYDTEQGDSLFMRADSMFLFTRNTLDDRREAEALAREAAEGREAAAPDAQTPRLPQPGDEDPSQGGAEADAPAPGDGAEEGAEHLPEPGAVPPADSTRHVAGADSLSRDAADSVQLPAADAKALRKEAEARAKAEARAAKAAARKEKLERIAEERQARTTARLLKEKEREEARLNALRLKAESKLRARQARAARRGKSVETDSTALQRIDSLMAGNAHEQDSLARVLGDSTTVDSAALLPAGGADSVGLSAADSAAADTGMVYRLVKGYRNVKIYRSDFQSVCDSLVAISTDSTIHLYIDPVLWNQNNQITSDVMDVYTAGRQLVKADFIGTPMMASELDTAHYNQVTGKAMTAFFRDNQIYRNDVNGNAQTIYYMEDGEPPEIVMMGVVESGSITFYIEEKQVAGITYRGNPAYKFYPIDKVPADEPTELKGFRWEGARRPAKTEVFDREIRPSERGMRSELPKPDFPIAHRIEEHKRRLIEERRWADRDDVLAPQIDEWMRSLGFVPGEPRK